LGLAVLALPHLVGAPHGEYGAALAPAESRARFRLRRDLDQPGLLVASRQPFGLVVSETGARLSPAGSPTKRTENGLATYPRVPIPDAEPARSSPRKRTRSFDAKLLSTGVPG
jgi:hypothetical protein